MQKYIASSWGNPTQHSNIGDIAGNYGFREVSFQGLSSPGFRPRGIYSQVLIPGAFIAQSIYLMGHSPHGNLIPIRLHFRVICPRWFWFFQGIVPQEKALKIAPVGDLYV